MLATMLGRHPEVYAFAGEGGFFEHADSLQQETAEDQEERLAHMIAHEADPVLRGEARQTIADHLRESNTQGTIARYTAGKQFVAAKHDATRWVQKATSYIFHINRILDAYPQAHLLFFVRNPLDIAASVYRRGYFHGHIWRTILGWNTGVRRALEHEQKAPERVRLFRYEDLVTDTKTAVEDILAFCNLEFDSRCTKVPQVNPSENPYEIGDEYKEPDNSRVQYHSQVLDVADESAVRTLVSSELLNRVYPDLPDFEGEPQWHHRLQAIRLVFSSLGASILQHGQMAVDDPSHTLRRLKKRLWE